MKKLRSLLMAAAVGVASVPLIIAARVVYNQSLVNETALAYSTTYTIDLGSSILPHSNIDALSMQAVYSSTTISAVNFTDGSASTMTVTVSSYPAVAGRRGSNTLTVTKNTANVLSSAYFTLNGIRFIQGDLWSRQSLSTNTAVNIKNGINNYGSTNGTFVATTSSNVVTIRCISSGTFCNAYGLTSSTQAALGAGNATFRYGRNNGFVVINGVVLTEGTNWTAATSSNTTASSIRSAIAGNSTLSSLINSTVTVITKGVIFSTSSSVGSNKNYSVFSSSQAALKISNNRFYGGTDGNVVTASSKINVASHHLTTGLPVLFTKTAGTSPQNLTANATYYAIRIDADNFKLATTKNNAIAGTNITISTQSAVGKGTFKFTPLALTGTPSFKWQYSNDNSNWSNLSVSSVTMTSLAPATTQWDFGNLNWHYVRLNVVGPTTGGINLIVTGIGKSSD